MTAFALLLVLLSAVLHATWNLAAKRASGGLAFALLLNVVAVVVLAPVVITFLLLDQPHIGLAELGMMLGSAVLQSAYFIMLFRGYRLGDLSLVYPLARGTGPLVATIGAITLLGERPSILALTGAILISLGALFLTGGPAMLRSRNAGTAALYGLATGVLIGAYTLWDKQAVSVFMIAPLLQYYGAAVACCLLLLPFVRGREADVKREWREHKPALAIVGILSPISYILVLTALTISPVSYVAPTREISILLGAVLGTRLLAESDAQRKLIASGAMMLGVIALALG
jgi:drug/metabolite transporter (DMT)-like permease